MQVQAEIVQKFHFAATPRWYDNGDDWCLHVWADNLVELQKKVTDALIKENFLYPDATYLTLESVIQYAGYEIPLTALESCEESLTHTGNEYELLYIKRGPFVPVKLDARDFMNSLRNSKYFNKLLDEKEAKDAADEIERKRATAQDDYEKCMRKIEKFKRDYPELVTNDK